MAWQLVSEPRDAKVIPIRTVFKCVISSRIVSPFFSSDNLANDAPSNREHHPSHMPFHGGGVARSKSARSVRRMPCVGEVEFVKIGTGFPRCYELIL